MTASSSPPDVTVLVPTQHKRDAWLKQAVASLSYDGPVLLLENDGELAEAWNAGVEAAQTEWVLFWSDDDVALPDFIPALRMWTRDTDVVYPTAILANHDLSERTEVIEAAPFCPHRLLRGNYVTGVALARRSKVLEAGGFRDVPMEDWDLWLRMLANGARFKPAPNARFLYRKHDGGRNRAVEQQGPDGDLWNQVAPQTVEPVKATFYNQGTPATTYLRCQLPARYLPGVVMPDGTWGISPEGMVGHEGPCAVFQFPGDKVRALATQVLREIGVRVLVEVDDNYLLKPGRDWLTKAGWVEKSGKGSAHSISGHRWIAERSDGAIVTNETLARSYRKLGIPVYVCPNGVDPADWPEPVKPDDGVFRIAWVASNSHLIDIPIVTKAMRWASEQPGVEVYAVGMDPKWSFQYGYLPWLHDLAAYRDVFRNFDVGIAPVKQVPHALGRSDVKALEYAMGLCCPVLSDAAPYSTWKHGENCLKADGPKGFLEQLKRLVNDRPLAAELAARARDYTLTERTAKAQIGLWEEAVGGA